MDYYYDICDKTIRNKNENNHLQGLTHNEFEKCIRIRNPIKSPDFFDIDKKFNEYITNDNKKYDLYLTKFDFELDFDANCKSYVGSANIEFYLYVECKFQYNTTICLRKRFLLGSIETFSERRFKFSHFYEMIITTNSKKRYMNYEYYI